MYSKTGFTHTAKIFKIHGSLVKHFRSKLKIGFNDFCYRAQISTRTLAAIEKGGERNIKSLTLLKILHGFNNTRKGLRTKLVTDKDLTVGFYSINDPARMETMTSTHLKLSVYLNKELHRSIESYCSKYGGSKNKVITSILKQYLNIADSPLEYERNVNWFDKLRASSKAKGTWVY